MKASTHILRIRICRSDKLKVVLLITFQKNREDTLLHFLLSNLFPNVPWEMLLLKIAARMLLHFEIQKHISPLQFR